MGNLKVDGNYVSGSNFISRADRWEGMKRIARLIAHEQHGLLRQQPRLLKIMR